MGIHSIKIQNFKSIRETDEILIKPLNILIGPNGAGKSNFISFFKFLNKLFEQQLQLYISQNGRAENFLYFGRKKSDFLSGKITFDNDYKNQYKFKMVPDQAGDLIFAEEWSNYGNNNETLMGLPGSYESILKDADKIKGGAKTRTTYLRAYFSTFKIFHFHDTSFNSKVKQPSGATDYSYLYEDGSNLAAFLYRLQETHNKHFLMIEKVVQSIAPFFDRFLLKPDEINPNQIYLRWLEKGSDQVFTAHNLSDGTLRMICLTTLLIQPEPPKTIIIDEPELGLHPFAINKLAAMLQSASVNSQIIVSTQSVTLLNEFEADDIIVVERANQQTTFKRLSTDKLQDWLNDYTLGDLWQKNILGGRPR